MSDALTPFYGLTEPTPGADTNTWGPLLNTNFVSIDALLANPNPVTHAGTLVVSTVTMDLSQALIWTYTVVGATTFAFSNVPATANRASVVLLALTNGGTGTLTWPGSVTWLSGNAPTFKVSGVDFVRFFTLNQGTTWYGEKLYNMAPVRTLYATQNLTTTSGTEVSLASFSLPAGTLGTNGQSIRITLGMLAPAGGATVKVNFGGTELISSTGLGANDHLSWSTHVVRTGATSQITAGGYIFKNVSGVNTGAARISPAETLSGAITIDFRGNATSGGQTLTLDYAVIELVSVA